MKNKTRKTECNISSVPVGTFNTVQSEKDKFSWCIAEEYKINSTNLNSTKIFRLNTPNFLPFLKTFIIPASASNKIRLFYSPPLSCYSNVDYGQSRYLKITSENIELAELPKLSYECKQTNLIVNRESQRNLPLDKNKELYHVSHCLHC